METRLKLAPLPLQQKSLIEEVEEPAFSWECSLAGMMASDHSPRGGPVWERRYSVRAPLARRGLVCVPADRIHKAIVEALAPGAMTPPAVGERQDDAPSGLEPGGVYRFASGRLG
jgi:hypothetical protein